MAILKSVVIVIIAVIIWYVIYGYLTEVPLPDIDLTEWWGPEETRHKQDTGVRSFRVNFSESVVNDLKHRLRSYRPPARPLEGINFEYGFNSKELDNWVKYWAEDYPYRQRETYLNKFPHYKTNIQGLDIHFIKVRAKDIGNREVVPLLIMHGWPGSVLEFYEVIPDLIAVSADRDFVLEVIAPSLPGYGFSDAPVRPGLGTDKMAIVFRNLMHKLGYKKFYLQGGDMGALVANDIATLFPDNVLGYHTNALYTQTPLTSVLTLLGSIYPPMMLRADVVDRIYPLSKLLTFYLEEFGYLHIQSTKPDTVGVGLSDSPAGLIAYMLEKFSTGTRFVHRSLPDGGLSAFYTKDLLIDNVMMYWINNSMTTAMRMYAEVFNKRYFALRMNEIQTPVPICIIQAPCEITYLPPWLVRLKFPNLLNETILQEGGHFLAMEMPKLFAQNVLDAVSAFRVWHKNNQATNANN